MGRRSNYHITIFEMFSPVIDDSIIRLLLSSGAGKKLYARQSNCGSAAFCRELKGVGSWRIPYVVKTEMGKKMQKLKRTCQCLTKTHLKKHRLLSQSLYEIGLQTMQSSACVFISKDVQVICYATGLVVRADKEVERAPLRLQLSSRLVKKNIAESSNCLVT